MWYSDCYEAVHTQYKHNTRLFIACLCATSSHTKLSANVALARKMFGYLTSERPLPRTQFIRTHATNIQQWLSTGVFKGGKTQAFYRALIGDPMATPIDIWIERAFGYQKRPTRSQQTSIEQIICYEASLNGYSPADYQSLLWLKARRKGSQSYATYLAQPRLF